ncbi:hypothetical protein [Marinomonas posidonica]|uniref:hypothetical protein n=1 Tax=Marinomonas posidonica TaxID=936476 RepID=UPI0003092ED4|nr:hypothetical protein [Marinomonas posidonica]
MKILSLKGVEGSVLKAWKWLERPLHHADGLENMEGIPFELMDENALDIIYQNAKPYLNYKIDVEMLWRD